MVTKQKLGTITSFKYLGATVSDEGLNYLNDWASHCSSYKAELIWRENNSGEADELFRHFHVSVCGQETETLSLFSENRRHCLSPGKLNGSFISGNSRRAFGACDEGAPPSTWHHSGTLTLECQPFEASSASRNFEILLFWILTFWNCAL